MRGCVDYPGIITQVVRLFPPRGSWRLLCGTQRRGVGGWRKECGFAVGWVIKPSSFPSPGSGSVLMALSPPCHSGGFSRSKAVHHPIGMGRQMTAVT